MHPKQALEKRGNGSQDAVFRLGQIVTAGRIGSALTYEAMRELIEFEKSDGHLALGYSRWVDFLEQSEYSPMTKYKYYERKAVFEKENPDVWDRLTDLGVPINLRKRLPDGAFKIENDAIVITGEDGTSQSLPLAEANRTQVIETIKILHESLLEKTKKLEKGQEDFRRLKEKLLDAEEHQGNGRVIPALEKVHTVAIGGLAALAGELEKLSEEEASGYCEREFTLLVTQYNRVNQILCEKLGELPADIEELLSD